MARRQELGETRRQQILDAAQEVFARRGFHQARMDDIVQESGLSKGALYWYFRSKDHIIASLLDRFLSRELQDLHQLAQDEGDVSDRLLTLTRRITSEVEGMAHLLPIFYEFYATAAREEGVRRSLWRYFEDYRRLLASLLRQGADKGEFRSVDAELVAGTIVGLYEGLMLLWVVNPEGFSLADVAVASMQILLRGLRPER